MAEEYDEQWHYGNGMIRLLLAGPFYGFGLEGGRATEIDHAIRREGLFSLRYQNMYVVCSGPKIETVLLRILTEEERCGKVYQAATLNDILEGIYHGEALSAEQPHHRPTDGDEEAPF